MPNTTNFNFPTPADTDLVKDGASAIRSLGNSIDTAFVDLKGGTTGQVLSKASNTDLDFTWSSVDPLTILDAKGDLISATAADTPARLASSGVNGDVLTVDTSTSTGLKWAAPASGGMTLISTTTLTGASVSLTSIPSGYINLQLHIVNFLPATDSTSLQFQFNSDTGSNYYRNLTWTGSSGGGGNPSLAASSTVDNSVATYNFSRITIFNYLNTTSAKLVEYTSINTDPTTTTTVKSASGIQTWDNTAAISSIQLFAASGNLTSGTVLLYGVK